MCSSKPVNHFDEENKATIQHSSPKVLLIFYSIPHYLVKPAIILLRYSKQYPLQGD